MRFAVMGALIGAGLMACAFSLAPQENPVFAQRPANLSGPAADDVLAFHTSLGDKLQQLTLIDPRQRALCVYHIDSQKGVVTLKSVRNFHWDTQLLEFNGTNPRPQEMRAMLERP